MYDAASLERTFAIARRYNTYSHTFVRGVLEQDGALASVDLAPVMSANTGVLGMAIPPVHTDLGIYQRVLESAG